MVMGLHYKVVSDGEFEGSQAPSGGGVLLCPKNGKSNKLALAQNLIFISKELVDR